jgi:glycosyltransferase involved in cell wall biosynthesis
MAEIGIITPCFNEGQTAIKFLNKLCGVLQGISGHRFLLIVVDDSSTDETPELLDTYQVFASNVSIKVLHLRFNVGHQMAIFQGMKYAEKTGATHFIVMDSDGEDDPDVLPKILAEMPCDIVNVLRGKRSESLSFRISYYFYKMLFRMVTGKQMNFGNYSLISKKVLSSALHHSYIHYPAFLLKQRLPRKQVIADRAPRLDGSSKMNFNSLVYHAFKSLVEFADDLLMLFLRFFAIIILMFMAAMVVVFYQKFIAHNAILGWASTVTLLLMNLALISLGFFVLGILLLNMSQQRQKAFQQDLYD